MSADNWAHCPRCTNRESQRLDALAAELTKLYGTVTVEDFDRAREDLAAQRKAFERRVQTFREDYEIYGAESGAVTVGYYGSCATCGLSLSFKNEHTIPEWNKT